MHDYLLVIFTFHHCLSPADLPCFITSCLQDQCVTSVCGFSVRSVEGMTKYHCGDILLDVRILSIFMSMKNLFLTYLRILHGILFYISSVGASYTTYIFI